MPRTPRVVALALILALAACGDDDDGGAIEAPDTTTTTTTTTTAAPSEPTTTTPTPEPEGTVVEIEVAGGEPVGGAPTVDVALGDDVTIRVSADVEDEVHVHGYDLTAEVAPAATAEITFTADIPGQFEVELEGAGTLIAELTVA